MEKTIRLIMMANKKKISALKKNYLKFLKKQEVAGEPFYD